MAAGFRRRASQFFAEILTDFKKNWCSMAVKDKVRRHSTAIGTASKIQGAGHMGFFKRFQRKSNAASIEAMLSQPYEQIYFDECKYVWKNYVPKTGQSDCLQGELLREIESIRCEAQENGNVNWDDDFSRFCDFISGTLSEQPIFSDTEKDEIASIMAYLKERGLYAQDVYSGKVEESDADMSRVAYLDDNIYDVICDKIGRLQREHPEPIPYEKDIKAKR